MKLIATLSALLLLAGSPSSAAPPGGGEETTENLRSLKSSKDYEATSCSNEYSLLELSLKVSDENPTNIEQSGFTGAIVLASPNIGTIFQEVFQFLYLSGVIVDSFSKEYSKDMCIPDAQCYIVRVVVGGVPNNQVSFSLELKFDGVEKVFQGDENSILSASVIHYLGDCAFYGLTSGIGALPPAGEVPELSAWLDANQDLSDIQISTDDLPDLDSSF